MLKNIIKTSLFLLALMVAFSIYIYSLIPSNLYIFEDSEVKVASLPMVTFEKSYGSVQTVAGGEESLSYTAMLFGSIPIKQVNVTDSDQRYVSVAGTPFGIKMFSDGVMVVGFTEIPTQKGYVSPAKIAGLELGDVIVKINGQTVKTNDDVEDMILSAQSGMEIVFRRNNQEKTVNITPVLDKNTGTLRTGMWVRDSCAGVGTMTFYDVNSGMFAGLGHGIKDSDTQKNIPLLTGEIVPVDIVGITKSHNGQAGELKGAFTTDFAMGRVYANLENGVYGSVFNPSNENMMPIASPSEVVVGQAQILTTVNSSQPQYYDIVIEKITLTTSDQNKNMVIRITDEALLEQTGGIVQGMSGSPIIQNGKLIGAVTHVFVNQVERGYAVFASNMVQTMDSVQAQQELKAG